jgi:hypothetical protein
MERMKSKLTIAFAVFLLCAAAVTTANAIQPKATFIYWIKSDGTMSRYWHDGAAAISHSQRRNRPDGKPIQKIMEGKIGDVLFDGRWRFQVVSVQTPDSYAMKTDAEPYNYGNLSGFDTTKRIFTPKTGYKLIVIQCRAINAQKSQKRLWVSASDSSNVRTALTDMVGSSYVPIGYDFEGGPIQTKPLGAGETITFPIIFSVPQSAQFKELIFTLAANGEREQSQDVRVSLSAEQKESAEQTTHDKPMK